MTDQQTPPYWVLIEAAKRFGWNDASEYLSAYYKTNDPPGYRALCDMIQKYEQPPVDRKLLCAREAMAERCYDQDADKFRSGEMENSKIDIAVRAIELFLDEGFGRD